MKFMKTVSESTREMASQFITNIETGAIKRRILPNTSEKFPTEKSCKSFKALMNSPMVEDMMVGVYDSKKMKI